MFTTIFLTLAALAVVAIYISKQVQNARKVFQFYWNEHAGRLSILHKRYYEEWGGFVQDGTRSIGPPFRIAKAMFSVKVHGRLMGLVTNHPWFVRDPNLFVPYVSEKYYTYQEQEKKLGIVDSSHIFEIEDQILANSIEYWLKGLNFWAKLALELGERSSIMDQLKPEPIYETRLYDDPTSIGGGLVQFRVALPHSSIKDRFITVVAGAQLGLHQYDRLYLRREICRDPSTGRSTAQYLPLTEKEAEVMVTAGLAKRFVG